MKKKQLQQEETQIGNFNYCQSRKARDELKEIYCIIIIGLKDYIKGIETKLLANSMKVQKEAFRMEVEIESLWRNFLILLVVIGEE